MVRRMEQTADVGRDNGDELGVVLGGGAKKTKRTSRKSWCHENTDGAL